ncbi:uncharacterized protein V2V93DRAFT_373082 [Kockiozyma suomiensis]|uniref:uncharacterized protein n=1 Tax=Kockiozyma suomiensis TaxID=1337062 RepID=UPI003343BAB7
MNCIAERPRCCGSHLSHAGSSQIRVSQFFSAHVANCQSPQIFYSIKMAPSSIETGTDDIESRKSSEDVLSALKATISSIDAASSSVQKLLASDDLEQLGKGSPGISLLGLKADTMASYLHNLGVRSLFALSRISEEEEDGEDEEENKLKPEELDLSIRKLLVTDRVILERGIRPLEKKIEYQIQKLLRAAAASPKKVKKVDQSDGDSDLDTSSEVESEKDEDDEEEELDDLPLSYKPRPNLLVSSEPKASAASPKSSSAPKKYVPPKINPTKLPSTRNMSGPVDKSQRQRVQRNRALEEYIAQSTSLAPETEVSVGSNVLDHGRGGTRTQIAQAKEDRVRGYEESNFVRLADDGKKKRKPRSNDFMGENWDIGGGDYSQAKRKKKNAWNRHE